MNTAYTKNIKSGEITYSHAVLQGATMHPDKKQVLCYAGSHTKVFSGVPAILLAPVVEH